MSINKEIESAYISERRGEFTDKQKIECKTSISTEDIKRIINFSAVPYLNNSQQMENGIEYSGKINFFICYEDVEGEVKKGECVKEFNGLIKVSDLEERCYLNTLVQIEKVDADLNGVNLILFANTLITVNVVAKKEVKYVTGAEAVYTDQREEEISVGLGQNCNTYVLEEDFEVPLAVSQVLYQKAVGVISSCQCGVGTIIVDGEVYLSLILLQSGEKRDIIKVSKTFPFRAEVDCDDAMPTFSCVANVKEKSFKTDITVDAEKGKSQITASVSLNVLGECYKKEQVVLLEDAFSLSDEIELKKEAKSISSQVDCRVIKEKFSGKTNIEELPIGAVLIGVFNERMEITNTSVTENGINVTGVVFGTALFYDGEDKLFSRKLESPFMSLLNESVLDNQTYQIEGQICNMEGRVISLDSGEIYADLIFKVCISEERTINFVVDIVDTGKKEQNNSAISVYIPLKDEGLFSLAKRLNVNPSQLVLTNNDLQFPLTGEERIVIYRQK